MCGYQNERLVVIRQGGVLATHRYTKAVYHEAIQATIDEVHLLKIRIDTFIAESFSTRQVPLK